MNRKLFKAERKSIKRFVSCAAVALIMAVFTSSVPAQVFADRYYFPPAYNEKYERYERNVFIKPVTPVLSVVNLYPEDAFYSKLEQFSDYDMNGDGIDEIEQLNLVYFEMMDQEIENNEKLVVVFVEPRLIEDIENSEYSKYDLLERLKQYKEDLSEEGYRTRFVEAQVYDGNQHQDGRTLLAMREFLKSVKATYYNLQGAVIVGSFPESMLVRRYIWRRKAGNGGITIDGTEFPEGTEYLRIVPGIVAHRADIVLGDMNGNWEDIYMEGPAQLESIEAMPAAVEGNDWPKNNSIFDCSLVNYKFAKFEDFFFIDDHNYQVLDTDKDSFSLKLFTNQINPETCSWDKISINAIAQPEIFISRINARHIAVNPDPDFTDINGKGFLDANGEPQTVEAASSLDLSSIWKRDAELERKILIDYFDRNHEFRSGEYEDLPFRTASIGYALSPNYMNNALKNASTQFEAPIIKKDATLLDYVEWLKQPAILRGITAHSSPGSSEFGSNYDYKDLEAAAGGKPWRWVKVENTNVYKPSFEGLGVKANLYLYRTMWENDVLKNTGANLFLHNGCKLNSPYNSSKVPYNNEIYGKHQNAENILFFLNGLALMSRAKVFNDTPSGFGDAYGVSDETCFGSGWKAYFKDDSQNAALASANKVASCKKSYNWSVIGDWTLRKTYEKE